MLRGLAKTVSLPFGHDARLPIRRITSTCRCGGAFDPAATLTGPAQERWLRSGLGSSRARWNVVAQQLPMFQRELAAGTPQMFEMDKWDGYPAARDRILEFVAARRIRNVVVLSGDIHAFFASDLKANFDDVSSPT